MSGFVDLHCHWVPGIDDGAPTLEVGAEILRLLRSLGFELVTATPHMRPGLFENERSAILDAYREAEAALRQRSDASLLPRVQLSCEHYFDAIVIERIHSGEALPYPGGKAILLEFYDQDFPRTLREQLFRIQASGLRPVIAHPERYQKIWEAPEILEGLVDAGAVALLDVAALAGKYGRRPQRCAEELLDTDLYYAACSDAHRPGDVEAVAQGMRRLTELYGKEELRVLLSDGPRDILGGQVQG